MSGCRLFCSLLLTILIISPAGSQTTYKSPPKEIAEIVTAPPTPIVLLDPQRASVALLTYQGNPPIALLSRSIERLGGIRIDPAMNSLQRVRQYSAVTLVNIATGKETPLALPAGTKIASVLWSYDGSKLALQVDTEKGVELWTANAFDGTVKRIEGILVNDVIARPAVQWLGDNLTLLVAAMPEGQNPLPERSVVPVGPVIQETAGKVTRMATFQDLLQDEFDETVFEQLSRSRILQINTETTAMTQVAPPDLYGSLNVSPDEKLLLVTRFKRPFSYRVPYSFFSRSIEVLTMKGEKLATIADLPVSDAVPTQGVPTGPRSVNWHDQYPSRLLWVEALDEGDPRKKVTHRDKLMTLDAPFTVEPTELVKIPHRFSGLQFTAKKDQALLSEFDRDRRWVTTYRVDLQKPLLVGNALFDRSVNDAYGDPGRPLFITARDGKQTMLQEGDAIFLSGQGASPDGDRPFLNKFDLKTKKSINLFRSSAGKYEQFIGFARNDPSLALIMSESVTEVPNLSTYDLKRKTRVKQITAFTDPHPQITGIRKQLVTYLRADGVPLSGTLYLPRDYKPGTRLPLFIWAYPLEFSDPSTAGQVRGSQYRFTFLRGTSPLFFVLNGYAVLMDATMPVVGNPETVNNTFVEQIVASAEAAIRKMDSLGVADPKRVMVGGHSYGAFMTANLLAHSRLFTAGIARSGAYNRTLTPFGFQSERRSLWDARDLYFKVSPFMFADSIKQPLLIMHGQEDNNSGTFPIQSERLFEAIRANGGTARLVMLPKESHGYMAEESVLHVLAEMLEWGDKYLKR